MASVLASMTLCLALTLSLGLARAATRADGLAPLPKDTRPHRYSLSVSIDPASSSYSMEAVVQFEVLKPTQEVVLHARDLQIDAARIDEGTPAPMRYDADRQQVAFATARPLSRGMHRLTLSFSKHIGEQMEGLFEASYPDANGGEKAMYLTYLCCIASGRQFMPLWDQPDFKAIFDLQLIVPAGLDAVSNMPIGKYERLPDGRSRFTFQSSPKMSSYLLFFAVGELERIATHSAGVDIGVLSQRGKSGQGRFALGVNAEVLGFYNDYFGVPYPLPKLDSIASPSGRGAMENWGAVFYYEPLLLMDASLSTTRDQRDIYSVIAHEVAHQWFGNLVTMRGWDDLWLNEGFASWMGAKVTDVFHPEWKIWLYSASSRERAMRLDARSSAHPIVRKVRTLAEAELAFDEITYEKGSQVIRMIEAYVGEASFRKAIRAYIRKHAYGNVVTAELWKALEVAASVPVTAIARDFTEQSGVPLIDVVSTRCVPDKGRTRVALSQGRFGLDEDSKRPREWRVPVTASVIGTGKVARQIVRGAGMSEMEVLGCGPIKLNIGESSYFRTRYDVASFAQLEQSFERLSAADQLGLLGDNFSLGEAGYVSFENYLRLGTRISPASDALVQMQFVRSLLELNRLYAQLPGRARFREFARGTLAPLFQAIGWTQRHEDTANVTVLRASLIEALAQLDDAATLAEARRRYEAAGKDSTVWSVSTRKAIIDAVGIGANTAMFDDLAARAARSSDSAEKRTYLIAAARALDENIARRALELSMSDAVPPQLTATMISSVAETHPALAFDFATARYDELVRRLSSFARISFVPAIAANGVDQQMAGKLTRFAASPGEQSMQAVERARSAILHSDAVRRDRLPRIDAWLAARSPGPR